MAQGNTIKVVLTAEGSGYTATLQAAQKELDKLQGKAKQASKSIKDGLGSQDVEERIRLLGETIGVRLPRSLERVIAESESAKAAIGAMSSAIVGIGALAVGAEIFKGAIEGITKFNEKIKEMPDAIQDGFDKLHLSAASSNDELQLTIDRMNNVTAKIEHKPQNNTAIAIDEARIAADKLAKSAGEAYDEVSKLLKDNTVTQLDVMGQIVEAALPGHHYKDIQGSTANVAGSIDYYQKAQKENAFDVAEAQRQVGKGSKSDQANAAKALAEAQEKAAKTTDAYNKWLSQNIKDYSNPAVASHQVNSLLLLKGARQTQEDTAATGATQQDAAGAEARNAKALAQKEGAEQAKAAAEKANAARMAQFQIEVAQMKQNGSVSAKAEFDFWADKITAFKAGSSQYLDVQRQMASIASEGAKAAHEALTKGMKQVSDNANLDPKEAQQGIQEFNKYIREQAEDVSMTGVRWREYNAELAKAAELQVKQAGAMKSLTVQHAAQTGQISKESAAQQMAQIHSADSDAEIKILQSKLAELQADMKNLDPNSKDYEQQAPQMQAQVQAAMLALQAAQGTKAQQSMQDQMNISDDSVWGQLKNSLTEFAAEVTNFGAVLGKFATQSLSTINNAILNPGKAGSHPWSNAALSIGKSAESSALQYGEGKVLGMFGMGGGKLGSKGNPMHVVMDTLGSATSGVSSLLGSAAKAGGLGGILSGFVHMLGFASGGNADAGSLAMVGEHGPELAYFGSDAHITSNRAMGHMGTGSGTVINNIDARGSTNPALTAAHVQHALNQTRAQAVNQAVSAQQEMAKRKP